MTSKIEKFIARLDKKERLLVKSLLEKLIIRDLVGLDIKKLLGQQELYRLKKGSLRIIFQFTPKDIKIFDIARRSEDTYRNY